MKRINTLRQHMFVMGGVTLLTNNPDFYAAETRGISLVFLCV